MVAAILEDDDVNVIRLDWGQSGKFFFEKILNFEKRRSDGNLFADKATVLPFMQSVADTRLAGAFVAKFVNLLKTQFGYDPHQIHIISHR
jgi:hypothetical protein